MYLIQTENYNLTKDDFYSLSREERGNVMIEQELYPKAKEESVFRIPSQFTHNKYTITLNLILIIGTLMKL